MKNTPWALKLTLAAVIALGELMMPVPASADGDNCQSMLTRDDKCGDACAYNCCPANCYFAYVGCNCGSDGEGGEIFSNNWTQCDACNDD